MLSPRSPSTLSMCRPKPGEVISLRKRMRRERRRERSNQRRFSILLGCSGWAAASSGVLFLIWGYIHREDAPSYLQPVVLMLSIVVPLLFLVGLAGTYAKCRIQASLLTVIGFVVGFAGAGLHSVITLCNPLGERIRIRAYAAAQEGSGYCLLPKLAIVLSSSLTWLVVGLTIVGLTSFRKAGIRHWGFLLLAMALFGWGYQLTDEEIGLIDARPIHIAFGILFSLNWMLLGYALWSSKTNRADQPKEVQQVHY
jgi:hypothetical protein